jgi:hypothetical protein
VVNIGYVNPPFPSPDPTRRWTRVTAYQHMATDASRPVEPNPPSSFAPGGPPVGGLATLSVVEGIATRSPWPPRVRLRQTRSAVQRNHGRPHPPRPLDGDKRFAIARSPQRRFEVSVATRSTRSRTRGSRVSVMGDFSYAVLASRFAPPASQEPRPREMAGAIINPNAGLCPANVVQRS